MKTKLLVACCAFAISAPAFAADKADKTDQAAAADAKAGGAQRMAGPMSRKVTKEDKKGIDAMYKSIEDAMKKGDVNAFADNVDFPVMMVTDNQAGQFMSKTVEREEFLKMMGKMKGSWNGANLAVLKDGKWKMKMMAEAGWGDTMKEGAPSVPSSQVKQ